MERRYLTIFIIILVASLVLGIAWNAVLDISNRSRIADTLHETFDAVKANDAAKFADMTRIAHSLIYKDYDEGPLAGRINDATDIYATLRSMQELKSVSLIKVIDRIACLAAVTFKGADGKDVVHHMLVIRHEDREGNSSWAPYSILRIKDGRKGMTEKLPELIDVKVTREKAKKAAQGAVASYINDIEGQIAAILAKPEKPEVLRDRLVKLLEDIKGEVEVPEIVKDIAPGKAVDAAYRKAGELIEKLKSIAAVVESPDAVKVIKELAKLEAGPEKKLDTAPKKKEGKPGESKTERERLVKEFEKLPEKVKSQELADGIRELLGGIEEGGKEFKEKLKKLAEKVESHKLAAQVAGLEAALYKDMSKLPGILGAVAGMLASKEQAGRLKDTGLAEEVKAAKKLAEDKELKPVAEFKVVETPKSRYLRFIARLKAIGNSKKPGKEKAEAAAMPGKISGEIKQAGELWAKLVVPYATRYEEAAEALAKLAPGDDFKKEANELVKTAKEAGQGEELPDLQELADRIRNALFESDKARQEKFTALAKLTRKNLQNAITGKVFAAVCMLAAGIPEKNPGDLVGQYAELAAMPVELKSTLAGVVAGVITNKPTKTLWEKHLKLTDKEKTHGLTVALMHLLELKSVEALVKFSEEAESQEIRDISKNMAKTVLEVLKVTKDKYLEKSPTEKDKLVKSLIEAAHGILKVTTGDLGLAEAVEGISKDALDGGDLNEARFVDKGSKLRKALQVEKNRRGSIEAKMRKRIEGLVGSFPAVWAGMKDIKEYTKWAFPAGKPDPETSDLSKSRIDRLLKHQDKFAESVVGKKVAVIITHHWYPDPEDGFQKKDALRLAEVIRVRFQTNPGVKPGEEKFTVNDFMLLQEMTPDWTVNWKLFRVCDLKKEYGKCREIAEKEFENRKAYFFDGKPR